MTNALAYTDTINNSDTLAFWSVHLPASIITHPCVVLSLYI